MKIITSQITLIFTDVIPTESKILHGTPCKPCETPCSLSFIIQSLTAVWLFREITFVLKGLIVIGLYNNSLFPISSSPINHRRQVYLNN